MKPGDLVILRTLKDYGQWEFWPLTDEELKTTRFSESPLYNIATFYRADQVIGHACEIVWSNDSTSFIYAPFFQVFTHIWTDCLQCIKPK